MTELLILRGIPASRKTTYAREWVAKDQKRVRVNRDDLRFQMFGAYWGESVDEEAVTVAQNALLEQLLKTRDVVLDNTNLRSQDVRSVLKVAAKVGASVSYRDFPTSLESAVLRDWSRYINGGRLVGEKVIKSFYDRYTPKGALPAPPTYTDPLAGYEVKPYARGERRAISFDIDGTLAHHENVRGPYETAKYHLDEVDEALRTLNIQAHEDGYEVIILSGRSEDFRKETSDWLAKNRIYHDLLLMRPSDQPTVNDAIIKSDLVDTHVSNVYDVVIHYDDRDRVVKMLRDKGMKVAQVAPGGF